MENYQVPFLRMTLGMEFEREGMAVGMNLTWDNKREASGD
jgi:hypothetical protein